MPRIREYDYDHYDHDYTDVEPEHRPKYKRRRTACNDRMCGDPDCPNCFCIPDHEEEEDV